MYYIREIKESENQLWSNFISNLNFNTFLHSKNWLDFNFEQNNYQFYRFGIFEKKPSKESNKQPNKEINKEINKAPNQEDKLVSVVAFFKVKARRGTFLFCPHGPQGKILNQEILTQWTAFLKDFGRKNRCNFIRVCPILTKTIHNQNLFKNAGYLQAPIHMHAELTTVVNLERNPQEILMGMRKTTRQMVRKGQKLIQEGKVEVRMVKKLSTEAHEVYKQTAVRGHFVPFSSDYLDKELAYFQKNKQGCAIEVIFEGKILSWGLFIFHGKRAFYHQGANCLHKKIPASYICHWQGMLEAIKRKCQTYDFWGVSPEGKPNHPWATISLFKRGFGGQDVELVHAQDYPLNLFYWPTYFFEKFRAKKRGFS